MGLRAGGYRTSHSSGRPSFLPSSFSCRHQHAPSYETASQALGTDLTNWNTRNFISNIREKHFSVEGGQALVQADQRGGEVSILRDIQSLTGHRPYQPAAADGVGAGVGPDGLQKCLPASDILPYCDFVTLPPSYPQTLYFPCVPPNSNTSLVQTILLWPENVLYCTMRQQPWEHIPPGQECLLPCGSWEEKRPPSHFMHFCVFLAHAWCPQVKPGDQAPEGRGARGCAQLQPCSTVIFPHTQCLSSTYGCRWSWQVLS